MQSIYDFSANSIDGRNLSLSKYKGRVLLIVNTASKCGFTPQYKQLEEIYQRYKARGLTVLGFPCNQFGGQEPAPNDEIHTFCTITYDITFQLFEKIDVNGANAHPIYKFLKAAKSGVLGSKSIKWNFTKFLIDREGRVVERYAPLVAPQNLVGAI